MKLLIVLIGYLAYVTCQEQFCYADIEKQCKGLEPLGDKNCNAKYGGLSRHDEIVHDIKDYVDTHISRSFDYLLSSTYFGNYQQSRTGFEKLFRDLSDDTWNDAILLIKHLAKRGYSVDFRRPQADEPEPTKKPDDGKASADSYTVIEVHELGSMSRALDTQKMLADGAFDIHKKATHHHDPEVTEFLEEHFVHKHADKIRELAGHTNDLKKLMGDEKLQRLSLFLFDEYLQKL